MAISRPYTPNSLSVSVRPSSVITPSITSVPNTCATCWTSAPRAT